MTGVVQGLPLRYNFFTAQKEAATPRARALTPRRRADPLTTPLKIYVFFATVLHNRAESTKGASAIDFFNVFIEILRNFMNIRFLTGNERENATK